MALYKGRLHPKWVLFLLFIQVYKRVKKSLILVCKKAQYGCEMLLCLLWQCEKVKTFWSVIYSDFKESKRDANFFQRNLKGVHEEGI